MFDFSKISKKIHLCCLRLETMLGLVSSSYTVDSDEEDNELESVKVIESNPDENNESRIDNDDSGKSNPKKRGMSVFKVQIQSRLLKEDDTTDENVDDNVQEEKVKSLVELLPQPKKLKLKEQKTKTTSILSKPKISIAPDLSEFESDDENSVTNDLKKDEGDTLVDEDFVGPQRPKHIPSKNDSHDNSNSNVLSNVNIQNNIPYNYSSINYLPLQYQPKGYELAQAQEGSNWISINANDLQNTKAHLSHDDILEQEKATRNALTGASKINRYRGHITFLQSAAKVMEKDILLQKERGKKIREETRKKFGW